ncbi:hypothetical protein ACQ4PT_019230 [Festuca glaucescens]
MRASWKLASEILFKNTGSDCLQILLGQVDNLTRSRIPMILWRAWHLRCDIIHQDAKESIEHSVTFLETYNYTSTSQSTEGCELKGKGLPLNTSLSRCLPPNPVASASLQWSAPPAGWIKVNSDASFVGSDAPGGAGVVARDSRGRVIIDACSPIAKCQDAEDAKAKAALRGIKMIQGMGVGKVILELDYTAVVAALCSKEMDRSKLWLVYDETKNLLKNMDNFKVCHVKRESNRTADTLAKIARSVGSCIWTDQLPDVVYDLVMQDASVNIDPESI